MRHVLLSWFGTLAGVFSSGLSHDGPAATAAMQPTTPRESVVDTYHKQLVADPYRWLESMQSPNTQAWADAQTSFTCQALARLPSRAGWDRELRQLSARTHVGTPWDVAGVTFFSRREGRQDHAQWFVGSPTGQQARLLLDPSSFPPQQHLAVSGLQVSPKARYLAYATSGAGMDWQTWRVKAVQDGRDLTDELTQIKFSGIAWAPDESGFFYTRVAAGPNQNLLSLQAANAQGKVFYHRLGTPQADDSFVFAHNDARFDADAELSEGGEALIITTQRGAERRNGVLVQDRRSTSMPLRQVVADGIAKFEFIGLHEAKLMFLTTLDAPRGKIVAFALDDLTAPPQDIVPQGQDTLLQVSQVGRSFIVRTIHDASTKVHRYTLAGRHMGQLPLPDVVWATGFRGSNNSQSTWFELSNSTVPGIIYRLELADDAWRMVQVVVPFIDAPLDRFVTYRSFATSADGTRVPVMVSHLRELAYDGRNATRMYGYGGFTLPVYPSFHEQDVVWMAHGGVVVRVAARGGGEYGERWHEDAINVRKQHTFDDFAAAARWLIDERITSPEHLGIEGSSNGGLLVGASMTQQPNLFGAVYGHAGVLDMLRFARFTAGRGWLVEYGDVDVPEQFAALRAFSPLHNVREGVHYPATLIVTGDHDDRVAPLHSYKFAAALQHAQAGQAPIWLQVTKNIGHGAGTPWDMDMNEQADKLAFFAEFLHLADQPTAAPASGP